MSRDRRSNARADCRLRLILMTRLRSFWAAFTKPLSHDSPSFELPDLSAGIIRLGQKTAGRSLATTDIYLLWFNFIRAGRRSREEPHSAFVPVRWFAGRANP